MNTVTADAVRQALTAIRDPDRGADIVSLGMVSPPQIRDGHVLVALEVEPDRGAALEPLRREVEQALSALPGVLSATVVMTAQRAAGAGAAPPAPPRPAGPAPTGGPQRRSGTGRITLPDIRFLVAVASGKGGVGKSTTAANLALALSANGHRVGLLDADIYGPSMPRMMGIAGKPNSPDGQSLDPMHNYGIKVMSIGFLVEEERPMIWRGPMVQSALTQMLRDVNWGTLDALVVDLPPGTGDAQLTMAQQVPLSGAVIVSTPQDIALLDARKGLNMFRQVDVPVLGIVENMSYFVCPHCGGQSDVFGHGGARAEADRLGVDFLGEIPLTLTIRETSDEGCPIVVSKPDSADADAYRAIAGTVWDKLDGTVPRAAPRIVYV